MLAIDTSTDYLSIAIVKNGKTLARLHKKAKMRHSILLVPMIDKLLKKSKLKIRDISCLAVSIGPGSFTGLRIGVSVVKGLAYVLKKPITSVPTLDAIALNVKGSRGIICPLLDAKKNKVYACLYRSDAKSVKRISRYLLMPLNDLLKRTAKYDNVLFLGDTTGNKVYKNWHPKAENVARLASEYFRKREFVRAEDLEPMYLYSKECDITGR